MVIYFHYIIPGNEVVIFQPLKLVKVQFNKKHPANGWILLNVGMMSKILHC